MTYLPKQVLESIHLGVLVFGPDGRLVHMNPAGEEILRASAGSLLGRSVRTVLSASPGSATVVEQTLAEGKAVTAFDVRLSLPSPPREGEGGASVPAIAGASPLVSPRGNPAGAILYLMPVEILSMVEREEEARRSAAETEMLAYGLAHEIKNPLGGILGAAQWILREEATEGERDEGVRLVLREARRINELVEKMLDIGRTPPAPTAYDLLPLLRDAVELAGAEAKGAGKRIALELSVDPSLPPAAGDGETVYRVVVNLLKNALDAVADGGTIRVSARVSAALRVRKVKGRSRPSLEVAVSDDGAGMTEEEAAKAFLPFYTTKPRGTGLGLVMARQSVARQGGTLSIRSAPGKGTTVTITLPAGP